LSTYPANERPQLAIRDAGSGSPEESLLVYLIRSSRRKKLGPFSEPARLTIGRKLKTLLQSLPRSGDLFPNIKTTSANHRSGEFRRRCRVAAVTGVSLHSYRHAWAQRAKACGYPQRFAQEALGHNSRAVHEAYAKGALVLLPPLDEYEQMPTTKVVRLRSVSRNSAFANV
jgi:integrase